MSTTIPIAELLSLEGKQALITGAAMGISKAIAKRYAEAGASLVLVDRDETKLSAVCEEIRAQYGVDVQDYVVDLAAPE